MADFDSNTGFRTGTDGRTTYHPWGSLSRGYLVDSEETQTRITQYIFMSMIIAAALTIAVIVYFGPLTVGLFMAGIIAHIVQVRRMTQGLARAPRVTFREILTSQAKRYSIGGLIFMVISGTVLTFAAFIGLSSDTPAWWDYVGGLLFGFGTVIGLIMLIFKSRGEN